MGTVVAIGVAAEMVLIAGQVVVRGRQLHFNMSTPTDQLIHNIMATTIYLVWAAVLVIAIQLLFDKPGDRALRWSIRLLSVRRSAGMLLGNLMFRVTPAQEREAAEAGKQLHFGSHSVGVEDGGPGMPITGWSTEGGDLRSVTFSASTHCRRSHCLPWASFCSPAGSRRCVPRVPGPRWSASVRRRTPG